MIAQGVSAINYTDNTAKDGNTYYYVVSAVNANGESHNSSQESATLPLSVPTPFTATAISKSQINLAWSYDTTKANVSQFQIQRSTNSNFSANLWSITITATDNVVKNYSYSNTGLKANTTYYYRVLAFNSTVSSDYSGTASATTPRR